MDDAGRYEKHIPVIFDKCVLRVSSSWVWHDSKIHLDRVGSPNAAVRMILIHGAGGNSSAMWPYAAALSELGAYVTVPDLPGYGKTTTTNPGLIRYSDWQQMLVDLVKQENDNRPLIIMGASMGGMLAYDASAATGLASHLIVTCLLDPRNASVRRRLSWHPVIGKIAVPALRIFVGPLENLRIPIRWIADMRNIANSSGLVNEVIADKTGGGGKVPLGWMRSFLESSPLVEPENFTGTPVTMIHPADDRWTPIDISYSFFQRITSEKSLVMLNGCGHFPVEEPGLSDLLAEVGKIIEGVKR